MIDAGGLQSRLAFTRNGPTIASDAFQQALAVAGVIGYTGDCSVQRRCWVVTAAARGAANGYGRAGLVTRCRALRARAASGRGLSTDTAGTHLADEAVRRLKHAKWRLWHGRWPGCRRKLAALCHWTQRRDVRDAAGTGRLQRHANELLSYLKRSEDALAYYAARRRCGEPISTAFVESSVNEIVPKRMNKRQQMHWNRATAQSFLDVRTAPLNDTLTFSITATPASAPRTTKGRLHQLRNDSTRLHALVQARRAIVVQPPSWLRRNATPRRSQRNRHAAHSGKPSCDAVLMNAVRSPMMGECSLSPKTTPPRSGLPMSKAVNSRLPLNCAAASKALPTTRTHAPASAALSAGHHGLRSRLTTRHPPQPRSVRRLAVQRIEHARQLIRRGRSLSSVGSAFSHGSVCSMIAATLAQAATRLVPGDGETAIHRLCPILNRGLLGKPSGRS